MRGSEVVVVRNVPKHSQNAIPAGHELMVEVRQRGATAHAPTP